MEELYKMTLGLGNVGYVHDNNRRELVKSERFAKIKKAIEAAKLTEKMEAVLWEIKDECEVGIEKFQKMNSQHEGYAIIMEEMDELWSEIKKKQAEYDLPAQRKEAVQAAAMLLRIIVELL